MSARRQCGDPIRTVLIVDDHPMLRRGLATLLECEPDLTVCGQSASAREALAAIENMQPDLVTVDLQLADGDGLDLIKELKALFPAVPVLVVSMYEEVGYAERAVKAGAQGYLSKAQLDETVLEAVRRVLSGETYLSDGLKAHLAGRFLAGETCDSAARPSTLSDREMQVFELVGRARTTRQIAKTLKISVKTVESHLEHIKRKLGLDCGTALARRAVQWVENGR